MTKERAIMDAIAMRMEFLFRVYNNPSNQDKPKAIEQTREEIAYLHEAYFEFRGGKGTVCNILGVDNQPNNVDSIYVLTRDDNA